MSNASSQPMSPSKKSKWKKLEELVASIENHLKPQGAVVKYSHRRKGPDGHLREVDATIEYKIGSVPILIIVECRAWKSRQGTSWIEQLVTKRENVGAQQVIAVSASGFTKPAISEAKKRSTELRVISEITDDMVNGWTPGIHARAIKEARRIKQFELSYHDRLNRSFGFTQEVIDDLRRNMVNTPIMTRYSDNQEITLQHLIDGVRRQSQNDPTVMEEEYKKALFTGEPFEEKITLSFPQGQFYNMHEDDKLDVKSIEIQNFVTFDVFEEVPVQKVLQYTDGDGEEFDRLATLEYGEITMYLRPGGGKEEE